jgi:hypothetical protein
MTIDRPSQSGAQRFEHSPGQGDTNRPDGLMQNFVYLAGRATVLDYSTIFIIATVAMNASLLTLLPTRLFTSTDRA